MGRKRGLTLLIVFISLFEISAQTALHKTLFDQYGWDKSIGYSTSNDQSSFVWVEAAHQQSLVEIYEVSKDIKYLQLLVQCIGNVVDRRDDLRAGIGLNPIVDYRGKVNPGWSTNYYNSVMGVGPPYMHLVHSGNITYAMARFAAIVSRNAELKAEIATKPGRYFGQRFEDIAKDLIEKTMETIRSHEDQWTYDLENGWHYRERCGDGVPIGYGCHILPMNMHSFVGRTLVQVYQATNDTSILSRIYHIAAYIKNNTSVNAHYNAKSWRYSPYLSWANERPPDDISHSGYTAVFPLECFQAALKYNGELIFTAEDIYQYANSFSKTVYQGPLKVFLGVDYPHYPWDFRSGVKVGNANNGAYDCSPWLYFASIQPEIFQIVADMFTSPIYNSRVTARNNPLVLALLAKFESLLVPMSANFSMDPQVKWIGAVSADFAGTGTDQVVALDTIAKQLNLFSIRNDSSFVLDQFRLNQNRNWLAVSRTQFANDSKVGFAVLCDNVIGNADEVHFFTADNGEIAPYDSIPFNDNTSPWIGLVSGRFESETKEELIAVSADQMLRLDFAGNRKTRLLKGAGTNTIINAVAGNFDRDPTHELLLLQNDDDFDVLTLFDIVSGSRLRRISSMELPKGFVQNLTVLHSEVQLDQLLITTSENNTVVISPGNKYLPLASDFFPNDQLQGSLFVSGKFNTAYSDAIVMFRGADGAVVNFVAKVAKIESEILNDDLREVPKPDPPSVTKPEKKKIEGSGSVDISNITIGPNPTTGIVTITVAELNVEEFAFSVYDGRGNSVAIGICSGEKIVIDLGPYVDGLYYVTLNRNGQKKSYRIIVSK